MSASPCIVDTSRGSRLAVQHEPARIRRQLEGSFHAGWRSRFTTTPIVDYVGVRSVVRSRCLPAGAAQWLILLHVSPS